MSLNTLFSTPIFTYTIPKNMADSIESNIIPRLNKLERKGEQFTDFFLSKRIVSPKEINPFITLIKQKAQEFSQKANIVLTPYFEYWIQDYQNNDYHKLHSHAYSSISGTYYIRANENAGDLQFHNPNPYFSYTLSKNPYPHLYYDIKPQKGLLVLFPSWLMHEILPSTNPDNCIRTSFSFNFKLGE